VQFEIVMIAERAILLSFTWLLDDPWSQQGLTSGERSASSLFGFYRTSIPLLYYIYMSAGIDLEDRANALCEMCAEM
jgi:hypothetical protein